MDGDMGRARSSATATISDMAGAAELFHGKGSLVVLAIPPTRDLQKREAMAVNQHLVECRIAIFLR